MPKRPTIAELAAAHMRRLDIERVTWGDGMLTDIAGQAGLVGHPLDCMKAVVSALARSPRLFESGDLHGHDSRGHPRLVRTFKLRPQE